MAKILTWANMPTGITKGYPTSRCPTWGMVKGAIQDGYKIDSHSPINASDKQLITSIQVSQSIKNILTINWSCNRHTAEVANAVEITIYSDKDEEATKYISIGKSGGSGSIVFTSNDIRVGDYISKIKVETNPDMDVNDTSSYLELEREHYFTSGGVIAREEIGIGSIATLVIHCY